MGYLEHGGCGLDAICDACPGPGLHSLLTFLAVNTVQLWDARAPNQGHFYRYYAHKAGVQVKSRYTSTMWYAAAVISCSPEVGLVAPPEYTPNVVAVPHLLGFLGRVR